MLISKLCQTEPTWKYLEIFISLVNNPVCWHLCQLSRDEMIIANMDGITAWGDHGSVSAL